MVLLAAAALSSATAPQTARAAPLTTGISGLYPLESPAFERARAAGARFVRIAVEWPKVAPAAAPANWQPQDPADPHYDWRQTDQGVVGAVQADLVPVLIVEDVPTWAQRCSSGVNCNPDPTALAQFATAAARRYSGGFDGLPRVRYWQGLNEPNLSLYFNPQFSGSRAVSADIYRTLIDSFYAAVKGVDPSNLVLAAGLGPIAVPRLTVGPMRFTRELLCMRGRYRFRPAPGNCHGGVHFDIFDIHPYTTGSPSHRGGPDDVEMGDLAKLRSLLRAADRAHRIKGRFHRTPLWIGELSWDSNPPDPGGVAMSIDTRWTAEALYRAWLAGVRVFCWYSLRDASRPPGVPPSEVVESGLYFRGPTLAQDQPKPLLAAFRFPFVAYPGRRLSFWGRTPDSTAGTVAIQILKGGRWRTVTRTHVGPGGIFHGALRSRYGADKHGAARAVYGSEAAPPFSMRPVRDFRQPPFG